MLCTKFKLLADPTVIILELPYVTVISDSILGPSCYKRVVEVYFQNS